MAEIHGLNCLVPNSIEIATTKNGELAGMSFVAKDLFAIAGHTSSFGHPRWRETHEPSRATAPAISRLLNAGAKLLGLTKMDQLAYSLDGNVGEGVPPLNSLYPDRLTGGSSSGSAAAVAGDSADIGIGTDTAGSIRTPAAACGLFALRPSHGAISSVGVIPWAQSFDVVGLLGRDPHALSRSFSVINSLPNMSIQPLKQLLVAIDYIELTNFEAKEAILKASVELGKRLDAKVVHTRFSQLVDDELANLFTRIQSLEICANHSQWITANVEFLAPDVQTRFKRAKAFAQASKADRALDQQRLRIYKEKFAQVVTPGCAVILPIMSSLPPKLDSSPEELVEFRQNCLFFNVPSSLTGAPEAVLPVKNIQTGLTYGLGLLGAKNQDIAILDALKLALSEDAVLNV